MKVLAIETSCDDTCVALTEIKGNRIKILSNFVSSQVEIHAPYGGVVPNLAVRAHYKNLPILLEETFKKYDPPKIDPVRSFLNQGDRCFISDRDLKTRTSNGVDLIAVTVGPGLEPCLWAGVRTARMLAAGMKKPIVGVNHLEGHIAANWLEPICGISNFQFPISKQFSIFKSQISKQNSNSKFKMRNLFPAICLIVSGGHTQLVLIKEAGKYKVIGQTRDDAAGEAFDKVAKLLGLGYPGGPRIASIAKNGAPDAFKLPRPMIDSPDLDFSFSGLKTAVLYLVRSLDSRLRGNDKLVGDLCASFQQAVVDVLVDKTISAAKKYKARTIMLSGGVAANQELRKQMRKAVIKNLPNTKYLIPNTKYCVDNAVMIGLAGYWKFIRNGGDKLEKLVAKANSNL